MQVEILQQNETLDVRVTVRESWQIRSDESSISGRTWSEQPTEADVIDAYLEASQIYPTNQRDVTQATIQPNGDGLWSGSVTQWNWMPQTRDVDLIIPRADLPEYYQAADIIAWGRANGDLQPVE